jgi:hypothetical protein
MTPPDFGTGDAIGDTIAEMFDIPEANLDGQMLEIVSGDDSYQEKEIIQQPSSIESNAYEKDGSLDAALIDSLPF